MGIGSRLKIPTKTLNSISSAMNMLHCPADAAWPASRPMPIRPTGADSPPPPPPPSEVCAGACSRSASPGMRPPSPLNEPTTRSPNIEPVEAMPAIGPLRTSSPVGLMPRNPRGWPLASFSSAGTRLVVRDPPSGLVGQDRAELVEGGDALPVDRHDLVARAEPGRRGGRGLAVAGGRHRGLDGGGR